MAKANCGNCGETISFEATLAVPAATVTCPSCGTNFEVHGGEVEGAETIRVRSSHGAEEAPLAGTMLLAAERPVGASLAVKTKGFLTQKGVAPGEGEFQLESGITVVGREGGAIRIEDAAVSSRHFQVEERGSAFFLRDLDSSNGTFLNGHRVRSAKLRSGDLITAGGTTFAFSVRQIIPM